MRAVVVALLGIALLAVLWWRSGVQPPAPVAIADASSAAEHPSAATVEATDAPPAPRCELEPALSREAVPAGVTTVRGRVRGRLEDPKGRGVRGEVCVWDEPTATGDAASGVRVITAPDAMRRKERTSASGTFDVDLPAGQRFVLIGRAAAFACSSPCFVELKDAEPTAVVTLRLQERAEIRGRIMDDRGVPIAIALLTAEPESPSVAPWNDALYGQKRAAVSDADGAFAFENVSPHATFALTFVPEPRGLVRCTRNGIRAGDRDVRFVVASDEVRTGSVTGMVRGADRTPLASFQISIGGVEGSFVDPGGRFSLEGLPWGRTYPIFVRVSDVSYPQCVGTCRIDRPAQELELQVGSGGTLSVCVRRASGEPVTSALVTLRPVFPEGTDASSVSDEPRVTDSEGRADFARIGPGSYEVVASLPRQRASARIEVLPGAETSAELWLQRPGALDVFVRDDAGAPLRDVRVELDPEARAPSRPLAGSSAMWSGDSLVLQTPGTAYRARGTITVARGNTNTLVLDTGPARADDPENPITDETGRAHFPVLDPGRYRIVASAGAQTAETTAEVIAGGSASAEVRIARR